jgi:transcriptional regulator with XRE-family HTH domain
MVATVVLAGVERGRWMTQLGDWVAVRRHVLALTQNELAARSGLSLQTVQNIEQGKVHWPTRETRRKLAGALGVTHLELLVGAGEIAPEEADLAVIAPDPTSERLQALARELNPDDRDTLLVLAADLVKRRRIASD